MTDRLIDLVAAQMQNASADTADCPMLTLRVAAGVDRRRRRRWSVAAGAALIIVAVAGPVVRDGAGPRSGSSVQADTSCADLAPAACSRILSARAELALRRANPPAVTASQPVGDLASCARRIHCRGPV